MNILHTIQQFIASLHLADHDLVMLLVGFIGGLMTGTSFGHRAVTHLKNRARRTIIP